MYTICATILLASFLLITALTRSNITGLATGKFEYEIPKEMTRQEALNSLLTAEKEIKEMKNYGLDTYFLEDNLLLAKQAYAGDNLNMVRDEYSKETEKEKRDYLLSLLYDQNVRTNKATNLSEMFRITQFITFRKKQAYMLTDKIALFEEKMNGYKQQGIETTEPKDILDKAKTALKEERYEEAEDYLTAAGEKLETSKTELTRIKKLITMSRGFFEKYWLPISAVLLVLTVLTLITLNEAKLKRARNRLRMLKLEREIIHKLIKKVQDERFNKGKISDSVYTLRIDKYRDKLAEIDRTIPVLEAILKKKEKLEKEEKEGIIKVEK